MKWKKKPVGIYKYNIIFVFEHPVINFGQFSPYKQLKRINYLKQYYIFANRNIQPIPTLASAPIIPTLTQTPTLLCLQI
jgi:hypothetical protein